MATLQVQARALGDPTRHEIFRALLAADEPLGVAELTSHVGLNHNAVRQHLAKLVAAGLVAESTARPRGRGRPRLEYVVASDAEGRWGGVGPYERLAVLLTEVLRSGDTPVEVGRRSVGPGPAGAPDDGPAEVLHRRMAGLGFEPEVRTRGRRVEVTLHTCPFASAAATDPGTVCSLHLGIAEGVAELVDGLVIDELVPRDPHRAGCLLRAHVEAPAPS